MFIKLIEFGTLKVLRSVVTTHAHSPSIGILLKFVRSLSTAYSGWHLIITTLHTCTTYSLSHSHYSTSWRYIYWTCCYHSNGAILH